MSEMCYFLHDDIDMGAHIYTCGHQKEMIWGECPCKDGISCDFFISKSEVDKLVRQYVNNRGKEHEIAERKMIYLDDAIRTVERFYKVNNDIRRNTAFELSQLPSAQSEQLDDGTLVMTVPHGMLGDVKRVLVDEFDTKNCKVMYQDEPEREILDELMAIMKEYYFTHRYEYNEAWENGFAKCMNLIPNVYMKRGKDR